MDALCSLDLSIIENQFLGKYKYPYFFQRFQIQINNIQKTVACKSIDKYSKSNTGSSPILISSLSHQNHANSQRRNQHQIYLNSSRPSFHLLAIIELQTLDLDSGIAACRGRSDRRISNLQDGACHIDPHGAIQHIGLIGGRHGRLDIAEVRSVESQHGQPSEIEQVGPVDGHILRHGAPRQRLQELLEFEAAAQAARTAVVHHDQHNLDPVLGPEVLDGVDRVVLGLADDFGGEYPDGIGQPIIAEAQHHRRVAQAVGVGVARLEEGLGLPGRQVGVEDLDVRQGHRHHIRHRQVRHRRFDDWEDRGVDPERHDVRGRRVQLPLQFHAEVAVVGQVADAQQEGRLGHLLEAGALVHPLWRVGKTSCEIVAWRTGPLRRVGGPRRIGLVGLAMHACQQHQHEQQCSHLINYLLS